MFSAQSLWLMTALATMIFSFSAKATQIHTGGASGAYHSVFCPLLKQKIGSISTDYSCVSSAGSSENIGRIKRNPSHFGFAQLDAFVLESPAHGGAGQFHIVRSGDVRECVFAVTRNRTLTNFGQIAVAADQLQFIMPPVDSGSMRTFEYLQKLDPDGLGRAGNGNITNALNADDAIKETLSHENAVTFFVQFPDPDNKRFKMIRDLDGHIIPVVDRALLGIKINDDNVYSVQETDIRQKHLLPALGTKVVTACTPMILFTGASRRISSELERQSHRALVTELQNMSSEDFVPPETPFARWLNRTKKLSGTMLSQLVRFSSDARERAIRFSNEAKERAVRLSNNAKERALPFFEQVYSDVRQIVRIMVLKARPQSSAP